MILALYAFIFHQKAESEQELISFIFDMITVIDSKSHIQVHENSNVLRFKKAYKKLKIESLSEKRVFVWEVGSF